MQRAYDVIVVGAGPTGCYAANELARLGYEVLVLEEHQRVGEPVHCTGILSTEACRRLDLDPTLFEAELSSARFFSPNGRSFRVRAPEARAVVVDRSRLDRWLFAQAAANGAQFLLGARALHLSVDEQRAALRAEVRGHPASFRSSLVIVAAGARSTLARRTPPSRSSAPYLHAAQLQVQRKGLRDVEVHIGSAMAPGGFAWAVPVNGKCRVGMICGRPPGAFLERFARSLEEREAIARNGARIAYHRIPTGPLTPSFSDRVLFVGDAAGQVKTTTGGGLYFGIIGAQAAVQTADSALRSGDLSAPNLAPYQDLWLSRIGPEQRLGHLLRKLQAALSDDDLEFLFSLACRGRIGRILARLRFDWHCFDLLRLLGDPALRV